MGLPTGGFTLAVAQVAAVVEAAAGDQGKRGEEHEQENRAPGHKDLLCGKGM
jgi:hypothetical protein